MVDGHESIPCAWEWLIKGLRRVVCVCIWLPLVDMQNGFMVSLSPGERLMRVYRLAASEWGNSTHHPSNTGGLESGRRGFVEGGHIAHYVRVSQEVPLIF